MRIEDGQALTTDGALRDDQGGPRRLLALMLLHAARRAARFDDGTLVLLGDRDRSLWDLERIAAATAMKSPATAATLVRLNR